MSQKCKVLIVEDELMTRQALKYILSQEKEKYQLVGEASNGRDAQVLIEEMRPHVVICDIVMPIMDGIELTKFIQLKYSDIYIIILSSYGDFEYVKSSFKYGAFEYILKPQLEPEKLLKVLNRISVALKLETCDTDQYTVEKKPAILEQVLTGEKLNLIDIKKERYPAKLFYVIGCNLQKIIGYKRTQENFYYESFIERFGLYFSDTYYEYTLTSEGHVLLLLNFNKEDRVDWEGYIARGAKQIGKDIVGIKLGLSNVVDRWEDLPNQIEQVNTLISKQFFIERDEPIYWTRMLDCQNESSFSHKIYRGKLEGGLYKEAFDLLRGFLDTLSIKSGFTEQEVKKLIEHSVYSTFNYLEELNMDISKLPLNKLQVLSRISATWDLKELREFIYKVLEDITNEITHMPIGEGLMLRQIYEYIDKHYNETLTLYDLVDVFHMSYSYLSTYFSHTTNMGFNEYLNRVRINKAKDLLLHTDIPIAQIGEKVGYIDQSYFSKVFKKNVKMSPSEYRRGRVKQEKK